MHQATMNAGWDTFIFGIPLIALLFFGYFRLDELFTSNKDTDSAPVRPRPIPTSVKDCPSMLTDPDGRPWSTSQRGKN
jgi:hypothetical protein